MSREERKELIRAVEQKRDSKVIAYVTCDRPGLGVQMMPDVIPIIHEHILLFAGQEPARLDLFLYSRGGQSDVPWAIVSMFREYCQEGLFSVLIPYKAHSAATVVALGADELIMCKKAELGPIDITLVGPYNEKDTDSKERLPISVEDVRGFFSLLQKEARESPDEQMRGFELLTDRVHPLALGNVYRALQETELVALRLLNTRATPFPEEDNRNIVKKISSEVYSHDHAISRSEALEYLGLRQIKKAEDVDIDHELWDLYEAYKAMFCLDQPFRPDEYLIVNNLEEHTWPDIRLACVESFERFDICTNSRRVRRLRKVPPQVQLSLTMPAINIPSLPAGLTQQQADQLIQQMLRTTIEASLNNAARVAAEQLVRALPQAGFEHFAFSGGWQQQED